MSPSESPVVVDVAEHEVVASPSKDPGALAPLNLLMHFGELADLLASALQSSDVVDSFLLAAAVNQLVEDDLHRSFFGLNRIAARFQSRRRPSTRLIGAGLAFAHSAGFRSRRLLPAERGATEWQRSFEPLVDSLAHRLACRTLGIEPINSSTGNARALLGSNPMMKWSKRSLARLPTCFRSMDLRPGDCHRLATKLLQAPSFKLQKGALVIGLRTSGSYLAPLVAAYLRLEGCSGVDWMTMRPSQHNLPHEARRIEEAGHSGSLFLLIDDPPRTGSSLRKLAEHLESLGVKRDRIVLLMPLLGPAGSAPSSLEPYHRIELPWSEWSIHDELKTESIHAAVREFDIGEVYEVAPSSLDPNPDLRQDRTHARATYELHLQDSDGRDGALMHICVSGAGYGYLGRHELAVGRRLAGHVPAVLGFRNGLLFQKVGRDEAPSSSWQTMAKPIAGYVGTRQRVLAVDQDRTLFMPGRGSVWQRFSDVLAKNFGRARLLVRPLLHVGARAALASPAPMVVDGFVALRNWRKAPDGRLTKDHFADAAFSSQELFSYDPAFDLCAAVVQAALDDDSAARQLAPSIRDEYESSEGSTISDERWLANLLANALFERDRWIERLPDQQAGRKIDSLNRVMSEFHAEYLGRRFAADTPSKDSGALCAIDLDGVLETARLGYSASTPAGVMALRALTRHDYRPVLVTGRSLEEVRQRCAAYGLDAAVAEYGGWAYDARTDDAVRLVDDPTLESLRQLATLLRSVDISVDPGYTTVVRAFVYGPDGSRRAPAERIVHSSLHAAGLEATLKPVWGVGQVDLVPAGIDKGTGLRALARVIGLDATAHPLMALAVGDTASDGPMLALAAHPWGPANSEPAIHSTGARVARQPYQAGLAQAVASLIGHSPGKCERCRAPESDAAASFVLAALAAQDVHAWEKLLGIWVLADRARRLS